MPDHPPASNGSQPQPEKLPTPGMPQQIDPQHALDAYIIGIMQCMIRGMMSSAPNVPAPVMLFSMCRAMGFLCANSLNGELAALLKVRSELKEHFNKGVQEAKIQSPAMPPDSFAPRERQR